MAARSSGSPKKKSLAEQLSDLTKTVLYGLARELDIPGRSAMTKTELVFALAKEAAKVAVLLAGITATPRPLVTDSPTDSPETGPKPKPKETEKPASETSVRRPSTEETVPAPEPEPVWQGEEGPELPQSYGTTVLRALPKNPHTAYVYWDIDDRTRRRAETEGEIVLRVYGESEHPSVEIPIERQSSHCYVELKPDHTYAFEIAVRSGLNRFRILVRSNLLTLPPETSNVLADESPGTAAAVTSPGSWSGRS